MYIYRTASHNRKYISDIDFTPQACRESWKFIPPLPDSNSFSPSNQPLVYTIPPTKGTGKYISLATSGMGVETGGRSPLLPPTIRDGGHNVQMTDTNRCSPQTAHTCGLYHFNLFDHSRDSTPCYLSNHPSDHLSDDPSGIKYTETTATDDGHLGAKINFGSPGMSISCQAHDTSILVPLQAPTRKCVHILLLLLFTVASNWIFSLPLTYCSAQISISHYIKCVNCHNSAGQ